MPETVLRSADRVEASRVAVHLDRVSIAYPSAR
jgi:hypothetical protein